MKAFLTAVAMASLICGSSVQAEVKKVPVKSAKVKITGEDAKEFIEKLNDAELTRPSSDNSKELSLVSFYCQTGMTPTCSGFDSMTAEKKAVSGKSAEAVYKALLKAQVYQAFGYNGSVAMVWWLRCETGGDHNPTYYGCEMEFRDQEMVP